MAEEDDEPTIEELCKPLSAKDTRQQYSISGRPLNAVQARESSDKALLASIRNKLKKKGKTK